MKIFISHSLKDKDLAEKFRTIISSTSLGVIKPWLSSSLDGLKPGDVLWEEVHKNLNESDKIVALLTPNSYMRPWVLYESGYVAGLKKNNVIPIIIGLEKNQLPSPLSAYVIYSGDDVDDLSKVLCQISAEAVPEPNQVLISMLVNQFVSEAKSITYENDPIEELNEIDVLDKLELRLIDKYKASQIFQEKLSDRNVKNISILTYTNEVEAGNINHHRLQGKKTIKIYKRSVVADLGEQQVSNIQRANNGSLARPWDKFRTSYNASKVLEEEFKTVDDVKVEQFFYDFSPTKRAYLFDDNEAIIASYENKPDHNENGGSRYRGMNSLNKLWVNNKSVLGSHLINELKQSIITLEKSSRSWPEEQNAIMHLNGWRNITKKPCLYPKVVFLDMDGVLYDSLPHYIKAWQAGFETIGIIFPEIEVYRQEGKPSKATVIDYLDQIKANVIRDDDIEKVLKKKTEVMNELGEPPLQDGAVEMVEEISKSNLPMFVVTGSSRPGIKERIKTDFKGIIETSQVITGLDYEVGKPFPFPFQMASLKSNCCPEECIVIENAPLGVESAERLGAFCIAINTGVLEDSELKIAGARAIFNSCDSLSSSWKNIIHELNRHIVQLHNHSFYRTR